MTTDLGAVRLPGGGVHRKKMTGSSTVPHSKMKPLNRAQKKVHKSRPAGNPAIHDGLGRHG